MTLLPEQIFWVLPILSKLGSIEKKGIRGSQVLPVGMSISKNWSDLSITFIDGTLILWPLIKFQRILGGSGGGGGVIFGIWVGL